MKKLSIRTKLIFTYIILSFFLISTTLYTSRYFMEKQFEVYSTHKQDMKNQEIVNLIADNYSDDGTQPNNAFFQSLGKSLLDQGIVLMVYSPSGDEVFLMTKQDRMGCMTYMGKMHGYLKEKNPGYNGKYFEQDFDILSEDKSIATVRLGYYGPYYYLESEYNFMHALSRTFAFIALGFFAVSIFIGVFMANRVSKPIRKVTQQTVNIANGLYDEKMSLQTNTLELDELSASVDQLAENLQTQLRLKKRMANDYSHEFRTPLAAMQSNLEAMIDGIWEVTPERMQNLHDELLRLSRMVNSIDQLVQIQGNNFVLNKSVFDLSSIVPEILLTYGREIEDKQIKVTQNLQPCEIEADLDKIKQTIINLVSNAIKYNEVGGNLDISVESKNKNAIIIVENDGIGISKEDLPYVFDHLFRTDISRARDSGGSGVGLSIVKEIVLAHNGQVFAESEKNGKTGFKIILPLEKF